MGNPTPADDSYKIINAAYPTYFADLIGGNPVGTVAAYTEVNRTDEQVWTVAHTGNYATLENAGANDHFASAYSVENGAPIVGRKTASAATKWTLKSTLDDDVFRITTTDSNKTEFVWVLEEDAKYYTIVLRPAENNQGKSAQWKFVKYP